MLTGIKDSDRRETYEIGSPSKLNLPAWLKECEDKWNSIILGLIGVAPSTCMNMLIYPIYSGENTISIYTNMHMHVGMNVEVLLLVYYDNTNPVSIMLCYTLKDLLLQKLKH